MQKGFTEILNNFINVLKTNNIEFNIGASQLEILNLERHARSTLNISLDNNFKEYLKRINGFEDFEMDDELISFWSINRIIEESDSHRPEDMFWMADYSINACTYGIHKTDKKVYSSFQTGEQKLYFIANSFPEFIQKYIEDPRQLIL